MSAAPNAETDRILRNSARCLICNTEIVSRSRHDFVACPCGNVCVDGGLHYIRRLCINAAKFVDTSRFGDPDPRTTWTPHRSDQVVSNVHPANQCRGAACAVHNVSDHHMRDWEQGFAYGSTYRMCRHDLWHADPDDARAQCRGYCDDCCNPIHQEELL